MTRSPADAIRRTAAAALVCGTLALLTTLTGCGAGEFVSHWSADAVGEDPELHMILRHDTALVILLRGVDTTAEAQGEQPPP